MLLYSLLQPLCGPPDVIVPTCTIVQVNDITQLLSREPIFLAGAQHLSDGESTNRLAEGNCRIGHSANSILKSWRGPEELKERNMLSVKRNQSSLLCACCPWKSPRAVKSLVRIPKSPGTTTAARFCGEDELWTLLAIRWFAWSGTVFFEACAFCSCMKSPVKRTQSVLGSLLVTSAKYSCISRAAQHCQPFLIAVCKGIVILSSFLLIWRFESWSSDAFTLKSLKWRPWLLVVRLWRL